MPLIQKSTAAAATIASHVNHIAGNYAAAIYHLNQITASLLALDDSDLAAFGNGLGPAEMNDTLTLHATHGAQLNLMLEQANEVLTEAGMPAVSGSVDVSPFSDKLAAQGRQITFDGTSFAVIPLPSPEPSPPDPIPTEN